jgi:hypothetical protein
MSSVPSVMKLCVEPIITSPNQTIELKTHFRRNMSKCLLLIPVIKIHTANTREDGVEEPLCICIAWKHLTSPENKPVNHDGLPVDMF